MPRDRTPRHTVAASRGARHDRHGRIGRSDVLRPPLPPLHGRMDRFDMVVSAAIDFLRGTWPELQEVRFEVAALPQRSEGGAVPRWQIDREHQRIVLFRLPIERLLPRGHDDVLHQRVSVESEVFRAAAAYVGREPWDLGPRH